MAQREREPLSQPQRSSSVVATDAVAKQLRERRKSSVSSQGGRRKSSTQAKSRRRSDLMQSMSSQVEALRQSLEEEVTITDMGDLSRLQEIARSGSGASAPDGSARRQRRKSTVVQREDARSRVREKLRRRSGVEPRLLVEPPNRTLAPKPSTGDAVAAADTADTAAPDGGSASASISTAVAAGAHGAEQPRQRRRSSIVRMFDVALGLTRH